MEPLLWIRQLNEQAGPILLFLVMWGAEEEESVSILCSFTSVFTGFSEELADSSEAENKAQRY